MRFTGAGALIASAVVLQGGGLLQGIGVTNSSGNQVYAFLFDAIAVPGNGTPFDFTPIAVPGLTSVFFGFPNVIRRHGAANTGVIVNSGIVVAFSTTIPNLTLAAPVCGVNVFYETWQSIFRF